MYRWEGKLMRMHTAVQLNQAIRSRSSQAQIVIVNFPAPPSKLAAEENCFLLRYALINFYDYFSLSFFFISFHVAVACTQSRGIKTPFKFCCWTRGNCGSRSVGHTYEQLLWQKHICVGLHDKDPHLPGRDLAETKMTIIYS